MAEITPIRPRAIIRLWQSPSIDDYTPRSELGISPAARYGLTAGKYGYGLLSPLGLDSFFDGNRSSFTQLATITRTDSFSMIQEENGMGQWSAVYSYDAERPTGQDSQIVTALTNRVMFASVYIDLTGDDSDNPSEVAAPEPWFGGSLWGDSTDDTPASYTQPEWAYRGMVGPVNAVPLEREGAQGRLLLSGFCSLGWLEGVIHENFTARGMRTPVGVWNDLTDILRENCELSVAGNIRPTDIGRYLIRAALDPAASASITAAPRAGVRSSPGTQSILKDFQRYAERANLLFNGLTPVIHFHRPRTATGGGPVTTFRAHHYRKAKNETERPKANRILVYHEDSVERIREEWIDVGSIARWGVISDSLLSVAEQATSTDDDIGTTAKREVMQEQAAAHARRSSASETGGADLIYTEGARWYRDWRLGDVVRIDDGSRVSADLIVRRVSVVISGDGSFSFTPGFGAQSDVVATIGRNVRILSTTAQERETIRLRNEMEDMKQHGYETDRHLANKRLVDEFVEPGEERLTIRGHNITGNREGIIWVSQQDADTGTTRAIAFDEAAMIERAAIIGGGEQINAVPPLIASPQNHIVLRRDDLDDANLQTGFEYYEGRLWVLSSVPTASSTSPQQWRLIGYRPASEDHTSPATIVSSTEVPNISTRYLNTLAIRNSVAYMIANGPITRRPHRLAQFPPFGGTTYTSALLTKMITRYTKHTQHLSLIHI